MHQVPGGPRVIAFKMMCWEDPVEIVRNDLPSERHLHSGCPRFFHDFPTILVINYQLINWQPPQRDFPAMSEY